MNRCMAARIKLCAYDQIMMCLLWVSVGMFLCWMVPFLKGLARAQVGKVGLDSMSLC